MNRETRSTRRSAHWGLSCCFMCPVVARGRRWSPFGFWAPRCRTLRVAGEIESSGGCSSSAPRSRGGVSPRADAEEQGPEDGISPRTDNEQAPEDGPCHGPAKNTMTRTGPCEGLAKTRTRSFGWHIPTDRRRAISRGRDLALRRFRSFSRLDRYARRHENNRGPAICSSRVLSPKLEQGLRMVAALLYP